MQWLNAMKESMARFSDRRRAQRLRDPAVLAFYSAGGESEAHRVRDISATGAYMYTEQRWYLGTLVQITLDIAPTGPENERREVPVPSITLWCKVVRHDEDGVGMEFVVVHKARRQSVHRFVSGVKSGTYETNPS
jgi:hypothetical protein